jgi:hypothetical protein
VTPPLPWSGFSGGVAGLLEGKPCLQVDGAGTLNTLSPGLVID